MVPYLLSSEQLNKWHRDFYSESKNVLAQNVCSRSSPLDSCLAASAKVTTKHQFNYDTNSENKSVTKPKKPGKCWLIVALNCIGRRFAKELQINEFKFSQAHLHYWDKLEKCNYFLNNIVSTANRGENVDGRLISFLLKNPLRGGGQWDMVVNLITKHGLMPKECFPQSYNFENCRRMNIILKSKLREYAKNLRDLNAANAESETITAAIDSMMNEIYKIVGICLGIPPLTFTWDYRDKTSNVCRFGPITPLQFYEEHVKPVYNVEDKVCLVTDPRSTRSYNTVYSVDCLGNIVGGRAELFNNQSPEILLEVVTKSLKKGEPVWFGAEIKKLFQAVKVFEGFEKYNFMLPFDVDVHNDLSKADRIFYRDSAAIHAMTLTALLTDENGDAVKFRVDNCLGGDGCHVVTTNWFKEYVFQVVVDRSLLLDETVAVFNMEPIVVPAWDHLGILLN